MDQRLVSWARAVKARHHLTHPVLWLFTDATRLPNPLPAIAALPKNLSGVVFRHDGVQNRVALAEQVAKLCRSRRVALTIAGDWRLAKRLKAGLHIRAHDNGMATRPGFCLPTASCHSAPQLRRAQKLGALAFLSPVFPTASHPGAAALGPWRWGKLARRGGKLCALGGVALPQIRRLPPARLVGIGAIGALGGNELGVRSDRG